MDTFSYFFRDAGMAFAASGRNVGVMQLRSSVNSAKDCVRSMAADAYGDAVGIRKIKCLAMRACEMALHILRMAAPAGTNLLLADNWRVGILDRPHAMNVRPMALQAIQEGSRTVCILSTGRVMDALSQVRQLFLMTFTTCCG